MPTRFFLRDLTAANPPTAGEKSTALPVDTLGANNATGTEETRALDTAIGAVQVSIAKNADATTAARDNYLGRFTSAGLAAQTIAAATWTIAIALNEANAAANSFLNLSVYIWRPSTSAVVGFIYDSHTNIGVEWGATEDGQVITFAGVAVTTVLNDVLVVEIWRHAVQGMAVAYTQTVYFNGATVVTDATTTDAGSYLENPNTINFGAQTFTQTVTGGLSFAGAFAKQGSKITTGGLTFTGAITKLDQTAFAGGLTFSGSVAKQVQRALTGALSFAGSLTSVKLVTIAFTAALSFSGTLAKQTLKAVLGALSFSGALSKIGQKVVAGGLTFSGIVAKQTSRAFTGGLTFSGATAKQGGKVVTGELTFTGALAKRGEKVIVGGLTFSGIIVRQGGKVITGGLTFSGAVAKQAAKALISGLNFTSAFSAAKLLTIVFTATLSFSGSMVKQVGKNVGSAILSFSGAIIQKRVLRVGRPFLFTSVNWGTQSFFLEVFMRATTGTAEAELYNITDGLIVAGSELSTTSTSHVRLRSVAITLVNGKEYRLQLKRLNSDAGAILGAQIVAK